MRNKRGYPRIPCISIARLIRQGMESASEVLVRDICTHGVGIYTLEEYKQGEFVLVNITLPTDRHETLTESLTGEVVWTAAMQDGIHFAAGLRFDQMEKKRPGLYAHIKHLEERS